MAVMAGSSGVTQPGFGHSPAKRMSLMKPVVPDPGRSRSPAAGNIFRRITFGFRPGFVDSANLGSGFPPHHRNLRCGRGLNRHEHPQDRRFSFSLFPERRSRRSICRLSTRFLSDVQPSHHIPSSWLIIGRIPDSVCLTSIANNACGAHENGFHIRAGCSTVSRYILNPRRPSASQQTPKAS